MAVYKFSNVSGFKNYQKYNDFLAGNPAVQLDKGSMFPLGVVTLASSQSSITFSNIPQTYTHLQLRATVLSTNSYLRATFNNDTGSNYAWHELLGDGSTAIAGAGSSTTFALAADTASGGTSLRPGTFIMDILDYTSTVKNKTTRSLGGYDDNGSGRVVLCSGLWRNSTIAAINRIDITINSGTINQFSSFALYGVLA